MAMRSASRRVRRAVRVLDLPETVAVRDVCLAVERHRRRPLRLHALPHDVAEVMPGWCGAWVETDAEDHVFFACSAPRTSKASTILHELGHMVLQHHGRPLGTAQSVQLLGDGDLVRGIRGRSAYDEPEEQEAELFASVLLEMTLNSDPRSPRTAIEDWFG